MYEKRSVETSKKSNEYFPNIDKLTNALQN